MSNTATNAKATKSTKKRATYGFELNFPETFTMRQLRNSKGRKIKYITLYARVKKALATGAITIVGKQEPKTSRKGRKELIYAKVNAKVSAVSTAGVTA